MNQSRESSRVLSTISDQNCGSGAGLGVRISAGGELSGRHKSAAQRHNIPGSPGRSLSAAMWFRRPRGWRGQLARTGGVVVEGGLDLSTLGHIDEMAWGRARQKRGGTVSDIPERPDGSLSAAMCFRCPRGWRGQLARVGWWWKVGLLSTKVLLSTTTRWYGVGIKPTLTLSSTDWA